MWLTCVPHGRDEEGARATVTPCRLRRMCKHARMHTCMHGDHVGAVRGICQRVSITSSPSSCHTLETPLHPTVPRLRAAIFSPRETFRPHFTGGRNKAGSFFVVTRELRSWFMTVHLIPDPIGKRCEKMFFVSNYLNLLCSFKLNIVNEKQVAI